MLKKKINKRKLKRQFKVEEHPKNKRRSTYPDLPINVEVGRLLVRKLMPLAIFLLLLLPQSVMAQYNTEDKGALESFKALFEETNISNMHIYSASAENEGDYFFDGEQVPRGLYGLFAANWREELPADFKAYAVFKIRHGAGDAYVMRFAGQGTQKMIALFIIEDGKVKYLQTLASHYCNEESCWQMDSWIQDFDGDTRLDILQKARMLQFTLMDAPVNEYAQVLLQTKAGTYRKDDDVQVKVSTYEFEGDK